MSNESNQIGFKFSMPFGKSLEIRSNKPIDEYEVGVDEEIEGIFYEIYWNDNSLPWSTKTKKDAMAIAFGCQWGANEMFKILKDKK